MDEATIAQTLMTLILVFVFLGFLVWGIRTKQFHNIEAPKYRMLENNGAAPEKQKEGGDATQ